MGHDEVESLAGDELKKIIKAGGDVAFLYCGSGDGRHAFASILDVFSLSGPPWTGSKSTGKIHITMLDINAAALARVLVLFDMMFLYFSMRAQKMPRIEDALACMAYVFSSGFIPPFVHDKMMEHVNALVSDLEGGADLWE